MSDIPINNLGPDELKNLIERADRTYAKCVDGAAKDFNAYDLASLRIICLAVSAHEPVRTK